MGVKVCTAEKTDDRSGMSAENAAVHLLSEANKSWNSIWRNNFGKLPRFRFGIQPRPEILNFEITKTLTPINPNLDPLTEIQNIQN